MEFPAGLPIRNVVGSSRDKHFGGFSGWLDLWRYVTDSGGDIYCPICGSKEATLGGHVVVGCNTVRKQDKGSNRVFILPLCGKCNQKNSAMNLSKGEKAVYLINYKCDVLPDDSECSRRNLKRLYDNFVNECTSAMASACLEDCDKVMLCDYIDTEAMFHNLDEETCRSMFSANGVSRPSRNALPSQGTGRVRKSTRAHKAKGCSACSGKFGWMH